LLDIPRAIGFQMSCLLAGKAGFLALRPLWVHETVNFGVSCLAKVVAGLLGIESVRLYSHIPFKDPDEKKRNAVKVVPEMNLCRA
jgi:hypothetical protein